MQISLWTEERRSWQRVTGRRPHHPTTFITTNTTTLLPTPVEQRGGELQETDGHLSLHPVMYNFEALFPIFNIFTSTPLHLRDKYCTFYSTTMTCRATIAEWFARAGIAGTAEPPMKRSCVFVARQFCHPFSPNQNFALFLVGDV